MEGKKGREVTYTVNPNQQDTGHTPNTLTSGFLPQNTLYLSRADLRAL